ncbi:MAG: cadmium-translocating P-type ATPase [Ruminococcaceae bacterium]|nr:cadmium-translocating P-type ATPase [Oscillospiraceae bacterium]
MTKKQKRLLRRILVTAILFLAAVTGGLWTTFVGIGALWQRPWFRLAVFLVPYLAVGFPVLKKAVSGILRGQIFDENFLMALATAGALIIGEYPEAVFVLLFYEIGELFESIAVGRSRRSIAALMDLHPDAATVEREGALVTVSPEEVAVGEVIVIRPGEKIPLDGTVLEGSSSVNTAALTGEAVPRDVEAGDGVLSGCINGAGRLRVRIIKPYGESTAVKILRLVEEAAARKAKTEGFITRFAAYYTPAVVMGALLIAVLPPLFIGGWRDWIYRALNFLVISCPCALVISVPLTFFAGIGSASKNGILVKGSHFLEQLASCRVLALDKTGTLTEGSFHVTEVCPLQGSREELLALAALAESDSTHPIAKSLRTACGESLDRSRMGGIRELSGRGVEAVIDGTTVLVGNARMMAEQSISVAAPAASGTTVYVAREGELLGYIRISDTLKPEAAEALSALRRMGVRRQVMLTGDTEAAAKEVAEALQLDEYRAALLPDGKVRAVERLLSEKRRGDTLAFVGDGINDAPVLALADVGVAMGALGSDAAIEAADVVIMDDDLRRMVKAVSVARKTRGIVRQNIVFSLAVKFAVLLFSALGLVSLWEAVFADVGVMVLAVLNAMRAMKN